MTIPKRRPGVRYEVNVCGGRFDSMKRHVSAWKQAPLIYRPDHRMFEGKADVPPPGPNGAQDAPSDARPMPGTPPLMQY